MAAKEETYSQFRSCLSEWKPEDIDTEDKALALLLGLDPVSCKHFIAVCSKTEDRWKKEDKQFYDKYNRFLSTEFPEQWDIARRTFFGFIEFATSLKL